MLFLLFATTASAAELRLSVDLGDAPLARMNLPVPLEAPREEAMKVGISSEGIPCEVRADAEAGPEQAAVHLLIRCSDVAGKEVFHSVPTVLMPWGTPGHFEVSGPVGKLTAKIEAVGEKPAGPPTLIQRAAFAEKGKTKVELWTQLLPAGSWTCSGPLQPFRPVQGSAGVSVEGRYKPGDRLESTCKGPENSEVRWVLDLI